MKILLFFNLFIFAYSFYPLLDLEPLPENSVVDLPLLNESYEGVERCVSPVTDQGRCSPWAMVAAQVLSDRFCRNGLPILLSGQDIIDCHLRTCINPKNATSIWDYLTDYGIASDECMPYTSWTGFASKCSMNCESKETRKKFKCRRGSAKKLSSQSEIKLQIERYGSVMAEMDVHLDFIYHQKGIYVHKKDNRDIKDHLGRHAVRCYGYGSENGVNYWKCANTWSYNWGDYGVFKIKMGEVGIDSNVWACEAGNIESKA